MLNKEQLKDKMFGSLFGVFIGDAMGLPLETMGPKNIQLTFGYVNSYINNPHHKWTSIAKRSSGTVSDDTQLTLALMDSFTRSRGYDLIDIKKSHVEAFDGKWGTPIGWGKSTRNSVQRIRDNVVPTLEPNGAGNGVCMKIAPLAIYCVYKTMLTSHKRFTNSFNLSLLKKCKEITLITHEDPMCIIAAYCQSRAIIRSLQNELPKTSDALKRMFIHDAKLAEQHTGTHSNLSDRLTDILIGTKIDPINFSTTHVSSMICDEKSSYIYNSYPLVAYCVCKYSPLNNFRHAILETINAGADADSNAAMVGAIVGAQLGFHKIPVDMIKGLKPYKKLLINVRNFEQHL